MKNKRISVVRILKQFFFFIIFHQLFYSCALLSAAGISSQGQPTKEVTESLVSGSNNSAVQLDHTQWTILLQKYVDKQGLVDYEGFKKDNTDLDTYLDYLSSQNPTKEWSVQELLAYYINIYNAYTVKLILDNYPLKSIKDIKGPWTKGIVPIGNRNLSLGGIENGILRKMDEARIHFAINCASISCPKLLNEAYTASKINEQLDRVTKEFIASDKNNISADNPEVSSIFDWYKKDFLDNGSLIEYINQYSEIKINGESTLKFLDYNWNLNTQ